MSEDILLTAGYCGLACKACSVYISSCIGGEVLERRATCAGFSAQEMLCKGCRSDKASPYCTECEIKKCISKKELMWCSECAEYPCQMINDFQDSLPHRSEVCRSVDFAKDHSVEEWDAEMRGDFACEQCGTYNSVYADMCRSCGNIPANAFSQRHWNIIKDSPERNYI